MTTSCYDDPLSSAETDGALFFGLKAPEMPIQEAPFPLLGRSSQRPGAVQGAPVLRGEANPGRRGPLWNASRGGKGRNPLSTGLGLLFGELKTH